MQQNSKRWLMSLMKTSGSERRYVSNHNYADERTQWRQENLDELPIKERIKSVSKFYNGKINYGLLLRFLHTQVGLNWDEVHSRVIGRIPTKLSHCQEMIFWFVAADVEIVETGLWSKREQAFVWTDGLFEAKEASTTWQNFVFFQFYVHPATNCLLRLPRKSVKTITKSA